MTAQRKLLLEIIQDRGGHLDADELFMLAKERDQRISLSTVYRNLNLLKDMGLLARRHFMEDHHHYEIKDSFEHCHLICKSCGSVAEFETPLTSQLKNVAGESNQFTVLDIEISIQGFCSKCRSK